MAKKSLEVLTETMFYVLLAFQAQEMCGTEIARFVEGCTDGRINIGPGTLYTILAKFEDEKLIEETTVEGRKRTYRVTEKGRKTYQDEIRRLKNCLADAERAARNFPPAQNEKE